MSETSICVFFLPRKVSDFVQLTQNFFSTKNNEIISLLIFNNKKTLPPQDRPLQPQTRLCHQHTTGLVSSVSRLSGLTIKLNIFLLLIVENFEHTHKKDKSICVPLTQP